MSADLECIFRDLGLSRFYARTVQAGVHSVATMQEKRQLMPALLPEDAAESLLAACDAWRPRGAPKAVGDQSSAARGSSAASAEPEAAGRPGQDPVAKELRQWEEALRARLRKCAVTHASHLLRRPKSSTSFAATAKDSAAARRAQLTKDSVLVDRSTALLAICRRATQAHKRLQAVRRERERGERWGTLPETAEALAAEDAQLSAVVRDALVALDEERRGWRRHVGGSGGPPASVHDIDEGDGGAHASASQADVAASGLFSDAAEASLQRLGRTAKGQAPSGGGDGGGTVDAEGNAVLLKRMKLLKAKVARLKRTNGVWKEQLLDAGLTPIDPATVSDAPETATAGKPAVVSNAVPAPLADDPAVVELAGKLPYDRSDASKQQRKKLFKEFDPNGNGFLSLAEIEKGVRDVLKSPELFAMKPVMMRAYQKARGAAAGDERHAGDDKKAEQADSFVEYREFRVLLLHLRRYYELYRLFGQLDESQDGRIGLEEFGKALPVLREWGVDLDDEDAEAEFGVLDANGGGHVLFDEFAEWAIAMVPTPADDDDDDAPAS